MFRGILVLAVGLLAQPLMAADPPGLSPVPLVYELAAQMSAGEYLIELEAIVPGPVETDPDIGLVAAMAMTDGESRYLERQSEGVLGVAAIYKIVATGLDPPST